MSDFEDFSGHSLQSPEPDTGQYDTTKQETLPNNLNVGGDQHEEHLPAFAKSDSPIKKRNLVS
jgi:hypothetical protein